MTKYIVDAMSGTILAVEHCYLIDTNDLSEEQNSILDNASDGEISTMVTEHGKSVLVEWGQDTGWGDNKYRWSVSYSPLTLRDEALAYIEGGVVTNDEQPLYEALEWVAQKATEKELEDISYTIISDESIWDGFPKNFLDAVSERWAKK